MILYIILMIYSIILIGYSIIIDIKMKIIEILKY